MSSSQPFFAAEKGLSNFIISSSPEPYISSSYLVLEIHLESIRAISPDGHETL